MRRRRCSAQDVTGEYVDLGARIKALQETRATYVRILAKATSIDDTLAVQQQITSVQTQIDQLQGQQQVLADRSDLATLIVVIAEPDAPRTTGRSDGGFSGAAGRPGRAGAVLAGSASRPAAAPAAALNASASPDGQTRRRCRAAVVSISVIDGWSSGGGFGWRIS
jgi:hypothetical protein